MSTSDSRRVLFAGGFSRRLAVILGIGRRGGALMVGDAQPRHDARQRDGHMGQHGEIDTPRVLRIHPDSGADSSPFGISTDNGEEADDAGDHNPAA